MKVALLCDYFYPFEVSGAEVSTRMLATQLQKQGINVIVVTPNYGSSKEEMFHGIPIKRFPFFKKLKIEAIPPFFVSNPLWHVYAAFWIWKSLRCEKIDVLHVHNKNLTLAAWLAKFFLRKPLVITVRDYRLLCDLGMCLFRGGKVCNAKDYFLRDIPDFVRHYTNQNPLRFVYAYLVGLLQYPNRFLYSLALTSSDQVVCLSRAQQQIYRRSGISGSTVIHNPIVLQPAGKSRDKIVLFVGRFTPGKGKDVIEAIIPQFLQGHPDWRFIIVSQGKISCSHKRLTVIKYLPNKDFLKLLSRTSLLFVPSRWPEPLSRAALDAISVGTPIIASDFGSMAEIIIDGRYGYLSKYDSESFLKALDRGVKNHLKLAANIQADHTLLQQKFVDQPIKSYISLYKKLR